MIRRRISHIHQRNPHLKLEEEEEKISGVKRALRQFMFGRGKTTGRNSSGCITSFHRGGRAKRLQRTIDLKRNTTSFLGVVERIEYDPNCSYDIALSRWLQGVHHRQRRTGVSAAAYSSKKGGETLVQGDSLNSMTDEKKKLEDASSSLNEKLAEKENLLEILRDDLNLTQGKFQSTESDLKAAELRESDIIEKLKASEINLVITGRRDIEESVVCIPRLG